MKTWEKPRINNFLIENIEKDTKLKERIRYICNECGQTQSPSELVNDLKFVCKNCGVNGKGNFKLITVG